jgi:hypothetical protein
MDIYDNNQMKIIDDQVTIDYMIDISHMKQKLEEEMHLIELSNLVENKLLEKY